MIEIDKMSIFRLINEHWPIHSKEVATRLNVPLGQINSIHDLLYELSDEQKIEVREVGEMLVAMPKDRMIGRNR